MIILFTNNSLTQFRQNIAEPLAFVPTMGALHDGHLSLVRAAKQKQYKVLVSIFVNPLQFNNPNDLLKYPRTIQNDLQLLEETGVDAVFLPSVNEVYPHDHQSNIKLKNNQIESVFEGHFRPGHFDGVIQVLHRFFAQIHPDAVFFGQKDLQQCMVVKLIIDEYFPQIQFNIVETSREKSGLAMSSRNLRLSPKELELAKEIYSTLFVLKNYNQSAINEEIERLKKFDIQTEYLSYVNLPHFDLPTESAPNQAIVFAGYLGEIRLIDNLLL